jgi:sugar-specific transcriptional regulator TrmB
MGKEIEKLEKLGFSNYEAKVFFALYQGSVMSAAEIAKEAKIPRPSVYEILKNFAKKGMCNEIETPSKNMFEIINSKIIEDKLRLEISEEYKKRLLSLDDCFTEIKPLYKSKRPAEYKHDVELIRGHNMQREAKFLELVRASNKGIMAMSRFRGYVSDKLDNESKKFFRRGGVIKSIYEKSNNFQLKINDKWQDVSKKDLIKLCEGFVKQGEDVRFLNEVPQIMAVFDESIVFISLFDEKIPQRDSSDVIIKNKRFASFVISLFNLYWDKADTLEKLKKELG